MLARLAGRSTASLAGVAPRMAYQAPAAVQARGFGTSAPLMRHRFSDGSVFPSSGGRRGFSTVSDPGDEESDDAVAAAGTTTESSLASWASKDGTAKASLGSLKSTMAGLTQMHEASAMSAELKRGPGFLKAELGKLTGKAAPGILDGRIDALAVDVGAKGKGTLLGMTAEGEGKVSVSTGDANTTLPKLAAKGSLKIKSAESGRGFGISVGANTTPPVMFERFPATPEHLAYEARVKSLIEDPAEMKEQKDAAAATKERVLREDVQADPSEVHDFLHDEFIRRPAIKIAKEERAERLAFEARPKSLIKDPAEMKEQKSAAAAAKERILLGDAQSDPSEVHDFVHEELIRRPAMKIAEEERAQGKFKGRE